MQNDLSYKNNMLHRAKNSCNICVSIERRMQKHSISIGSHFGKHTESTATHPTKMATKLVAILVGWVAVDSVCLRKVGSRKHIFKMLLFGF